MKDKITIIIPAHNRPKHLVRLLNFYLSEGFKNIIVSDSSDDIFESKDQFTGRIVYLHFPKMHLVKKLLAIKEYVHTPYVVMCAEDDYIMPNALVSIVEFLEANKDYYSGQGYFLQFRPEENNRLSLLYPQTKTANSLNADDPVRRVVDLFGHYYQFYYVVMRTGMFFQSFKSIIKDEELKITNLCLVEMWQAAYCAYSGKHAILPVFYSMREYINQSAGHFTPSYFWLKQHNHEEEQVGYFEEKLKELLGHDGFEDMINAYKTFGQIWDKYCTPSLFDRIIRKLDRKITNYTIETMVSKHKMGHLVNDKRSYHKDLHVAINNLISYYNGIYGKL